MIAHPENQPLPHYNVIVVGSGPGGSALAQRLAKSGKNILILERGEYLPREAENWDSHAVFVDGRYQTKEQWRDREGKPFTPGLHYWVGGNSKLYGGALFRMRERDFEEVQHAGGISPAWPVGYAAFEPYYQQAEELFEVHGQRGEDPTEPWSTAPYPRPPVSHEPAIVAMNAALTKIGVHPFHIPLGIRLDENRDGRATPTSACIRCAYFDGYPCPMNGKADAQVMCIDPMLAAHGPGGIGNVTLLTGAMVNRLVTDPLGHAITSVEVTRGGREEAYSADIVVVAAGALSSALLLLRSANGAHPDGLANGSGQVGRNYMRHEMSVLAAVIKQPVETIFQKTMAFADFYWDSGDADFPHPLGLIQLMATTHTATLKGQSLPGWLNKLQGFLPDLPFEQLSKHSVDFWLQTEDLPIPENRVYYKDGEVHLDLVETNAAAAARLKSKLKQVLDDSGYTALLLDKSLYLGKDIDVGGTAHQAGTARFGTDPATSVLDPDCRAHEIDNLYLADASCFPSISAVNPTLTIIANALRVADIIAGRLGV